jgi:hypothetical protein
MEADRPVLVMTEEDVEWDMLVEKAERVLALQKVIGDA